MKSKKNNSFFYVRYKRLQYVDIEEEIKAVKDEVNKKEKELKASSLAIEILQESYQEIRENFGPILNKNVIESFKRFTDGKYLSQNK